MALLLGDAGARCVGILGQAKSRECLSTAGGLGIEEALSCFLEELRQRESM
jgi:hypothetical protein